MDNKLKRVPSLDGLRAIAILLVIVDHSLKQILSFGIITDPFIFSILKPLSTYIGGTGVTIFFILSGYLITRILSHQLEQKSKIDLSNFYFKRFIRIIPNFYTYLFVICILNLAGIIHIPYIGILNSGVFLWNYSHLWSSINYSDSWFVGHTWALSVEIQFYLLIPIVLLAMGKKKFLTLAIILVIITPLVRTSSYFLFPSLRGYLGIMTHTRIDSLMIGAIVAIIELDKPKILDKLKMYASYMSLPALLFLVSLSPLLSVNLKGVYSIPFGMTLNSIAIMSLVLWLAQNPQNLWGRVLNSKAAIYIGSLSYSLYLWQQLFLAPSPQPWNGFLVVNLLFCYLAAELSYRIVEIPFLKKIPDFIQKFKPL